MQDSLTVKMIDGYESSWKRSTTEGVDAVLNILKNGQKVGHYNMYHSYTLNFDIMGEGITCYDKYGSYITIYSATAIEDII